MVRIARRADDWRDDIAEIDLNPVIVHEHGLSIVDALIMTRRAAA